MKAPFSQDLVLRIDAALLVHLTVDIFGHRHTGSIFIYHLFILPNPSSDHQDNETRLRLPSRKVISVSNTDTFASIGKNSNQLHKLTKLGKAGANR